VKSIRLLSLFLCLTLLTGGCNMPANAEPTQGGPNVVFTAAAQTVEAQLTQNALLVENTPVPATPIPLPTSTGAANLTPTSTITPIPLPQTTSQPGGTVSPTPGCEAAKFVADVTVPDGTVYKPGETFIKTWRLKNIGSCTWNTSYALVFDSGDAMGGPGSMALTGTVAPGQEIDISVALKAPDKDGKYRGYWRLRNATGEMLPVEKGYTGKSFYVEIQVKSGSPDSGGGKFAVTSVNFNVAHSGSCGAGKYTITASITTNQAGEVTYTWMRSDGATGAVNSGSLEFSEAGTKNITYEWTTGATGLWVDLYIDNPNHQQFGRATLNCP
jgi:hypothetical protein